MTKHKDQPIIDHDKVIDTLINENKQQKGLLEEIRMTLNSQGEFDGLSIVGGVKALLKKYLETKEKAFVLEIKLKKLEK